MTRGEIKYYSPIILCIIINTLSVCNPRTIVIIKSYYRRKDIQRKY